MPQFCTECGAVAEPGKKFCTGCGARIESAGPVPAAVAAPARQAAPPPAYPPAPQIQYASQPPAQMPAQTDAYRYAPESRAGAELIGMFGYIGWLILMSLPLVGLIVSIIMGVNKTPTNRRNLARAMLVFNIIGIISAVVSAIYAYSIYTQLAETLGASFSIIGS